MRRDSGTTQISRGPRETHFNFCAPKSDHETVSTRKVVGADNAARGGFLWGGGREGPSPLPPHPPETPVRAPRQPSLQRIYGSSPAGRSSSSSASTPHRRQPTTTTTHDDRCGGARGRGHQWSVYPSRLPSASVRNRVREALPPPRGGFLDECQMHFSPLRPAHPPSLPLVGSPRVRRMTRPSSPPEPSLNDTTVRGHRPRVSVRPGPGPRIFLRGLLVRMKGSGNPLPRGRCRGSKRVGPRGGVPPLPVSPSVPGPGVGGEVRRGPAPPVAQAAGALCYVNGLLATLNSLPLGELHK